MERIILYILLLFLLTDFCFSIELKKAEVLVDEAYVENLFVYNKNIYVVNANDSNKIYENSNGIWLRSENVFISNFQRILGFSQQDSIIYFTNGKNSYFSIDSGNNWQETEILLNPVIIENKVVGQYYLKKENGLKKTDVLAYLNIFTNEIHLATSDNLGQLDTIVTDCIAKEENLLISGDSQKPGRNSSGGLYLSEDYGYNWRKLNFDFKIKSIAIHNEIIFVGSTNKYLYKSMDYGETWSKVSEHPMPTNWLYSIDNMLFANISNVADDIKQFGLLLSTDNGESWLNIHQGLDKINLNEMKKYNSKYYVITENNRLFTTENLSDNWEMAPIYNTQISANDIISYKDTLFTSAGLRSIQFSTDNGNRWNKYSQELHSKYYLTNQIIKKEQTVVAVGQDNFSFCISKDNGSSWEFNNGGVLSIDRWLHDFEIVEDRIILATKFGTRYSDDSGNSWVNLESGGLDSTVESFLITYDYKRKIYLITSNGLFKSEDLGNNWELLNKLDNFNPIINFYSINENLYFYTNKNEIYISSNGGKNLELLNNQPVQKERNLNFYVKSGNFFVTAYDYLYVSTDEGKNWMEYFIGDKTKFFVKIEISGDFLVCTSRDGIFRIKLSDIGITPTSVETQRNYLYTLPPYPLPSQNEVKVQFYWDINLPMTADDITVYDITGRKLITKDKIRLEKQADHYGNLIWDCSNVEPGIYLINIKHGTEERSVKVVVE